MVDDELIGARGRLSVEPIVDGLSVKTPRCESSTVRCNVSVMSSVHGNIMNIMAVMML